jgi:hypothetical protein
LRYPNATNSVIYYILAKYALDVRIVTKEKVSASEAKVIINKVKEAIKSKYAASKVQFGKIVEYSDVLSTVLEADYRIEAASIKPLDYEFAKYVWAAGNAPVDPLSIDIADNDDIKFKSILDGTTAYYTFSDLDIDLLRETRIIENIEQIQVELSVPMENTESKKLSLNERFVLLAPLFNPVTEYGFGINVSATIDEVTVVAEGNQVELVAGVVYSCSSFSFAGNNLEITNLTKAVSGGNSAYFIPSKNTTLALNNGSYMKTLGLSDSITR